MFEWQSYTAQAVQWKKNTAEKCGEAETTNQRVDHAFPVYVDVRLQWRPNKKLKIIQNYLY
jgi:hypothetical protein